MRSFKDPDGDEWDIELTIRMVEQIESATRINLGLPQFGDPPLLVRITCDAPLVSRLIWYCVQNSAKKYRVKEDEFYDFLEGTVFHEAYKAFLEEWQDFFRRRSIGQNNVQLDQTITAILAALNGGKPSGNVQGQPELSPTT